jgi:organic radical activating enzyme
MLIKGLVDEDFVNYKKPSMYIAFPFCTFKCDKEAGCSICQNSQLAKEPDIDIPIIEIVSRYVKNPITKAIVIGGLEPFDSRLLFNLIKEFRKYTDDDIVIYTGYTEEELKDNSWTLFPSEYEKILQYKNIIIKFGRFIPNQEKHYDEVLGVELASPNQYARRIS